MSPLDREPIPRQIHGQVIVPSPTKSQLASDIAHQLGLDEPQRSSGGTVVSAFLDAVYSRLTHGGTLHGQDIYRKTETVLGYLGLTYDPVWDTSENADNGGGTVTARAYSRIRTAITGVPRCFVLNVTDAAVGSRWETEHEHLYRFDTTVSGRLALQAAGPGARIVYYSTAKSTRNKKTYIATAEVDHITGAGGAPIGKLT